MAKAPLLDWSDLLARPREKPDAVLKYGSDPLQIVELWRPVSLGRHPVVVMIHGGCWQADIADRTIMDYLATDLRKRGIAVWNVEYRGVDREGGGYPGTFNDILEAMDLLAIHAVDWDLDLGRTVAVGHSAGGHLALWAAGRGNLPKHTEIRSGYDRVPVDVIHEYRPPIPALKFKAVISLGGLPDLEAAAKPPGSGCGTEIVSQLTGQSSSARPDVFADTSLPRLAPLGVRQILVNGLEDRIIPSEYAENYARNMREKGDDVVVKMLPRTGHVELIAPESAAWAETVKLIEQALRP